MSKGSDGPDRNDWLAENQEAEARRRMFAQLEHDAANAPAWVQKGSGIMAALLIAMACAVLVIGMGVLILDMIGVR